MSPQDKILDRITKLLAHSESAHKLGSMEEAQAFAAKAQQLMLTHKLEDKDLAAFLQQASDDDVLAKVIVNRFDPAEYNIPRARRRTQWKEHLAAVVAKFNRCRILIASGSNVVWFVGMEDDTETCKRIYAYLLNAIETVCTQEYDREYNRIYYGSGDTWQMKGWKASFRRGALTGIYGAFDEVEKANAAATAGTALIRITNAVDVYMKENYSKGNASALQGQRGGHSDAYHKGKEFGRKVGTTDKRVR